MGLKRVPIYDPESPGTVAYWRTEMEPDVDPNAPVVEDPQLPPRPRPIYDPESPGSVMAMSPGGMGDVYLPPMREPVKPAAAAPAAAPKPEIMGPAWDPAAQKFAEMREARGLDPRMGSRMDAPFSDYLARVESGQNGKRVPTYTNATLDAESKAWGTGKNVVQPLDSPEDALAIARRHAYQPGPMVDPLVADRSMDGGMDLSIANLEGRERTREMLGEGPINAGRRRAEEAGAEAATSRSLAFADDPFADVTARATMDAARENARGAGAVRAIQAKGALTQQDRAQYAQEFSKLTDAYQRALARAGDDEKLRSRYNDTYDAQVRALNMQYGYSKQTVATREDEMGGGV